VQKHRHVPVVQKVQKQVDVMVIETVEKVVDVPVVKQVEVPQIQTIERIVEVPFVQTIEKIVEIPQVGEAVQGQQTHTTQTLEPMRQVAPAEMHEEVVMGAAHPVETGTPVFKGVANAVDGGMMGPGGMMVGGTTVLGGGMMAVGQQEGFLQHAMHTVGGALGISGQGSLVEPGQPVMVMGGSAAAMQPVMQGGSVMSMGQAGGGSTCGQPPMQQGIYPTA